MTSVKKLEISILDDEIVYGLGRQNNIPSKMRRKWLSVLDELKKILAKENLIFVCQDDSSFIFTVSVSYEITLEKLMQIAKELENSFTVADFLFQTSNDTFLAAPIAYLGIYTK